jgi:glutathione synthase
MLEVVELTRPKLVADGMFLVGLDVVGSKLMEVNVFSPGGFGTVEKLSGFQPAVAVVDALVKKIALRGEYGGTPDNRQLATL